MGLRDCPDRGARGQRECLQQRVRGFRWFQWRGRQSEDRSDHQDRHQPLLREAAQAEAKKGGASVIALAGKFDGDNEGQVSAIENLVSRGVKGILITPNSSTGILAAIKQARDAGVVVIALDTATNPENAVDATFATDNKEAGVLQGKWVKGTLGKTAPKVLMLDGTPGGTVDDLRHDGFLTGMGLAKGAPEIAGMENTNGDQTKAQTAMENLLQRVPDANAVYTINEPRRPAGLRRSMPRAKQSNSRSARSMGVAPASRTSRPATSVPPSCSSRPRWQRKAWTRSCSMPRTAPSRVDSSTRAPS